MSEKDGKTNKREFLQFLFVYVLPQYTADYLWYYAEIEKFCLRFNVLQKPLLETTDYQTIMRVQHTIEHNTLFMLTHMRSINQIIAAGRLYCDYIRTKRYGTTNGGDQTTAKPNTAKKQTTEIAVASGSAQEPANAHSTAAKTAVGITPPAPAHHATAEPEEVAISQAPMVEAQGVVAPQPAPQPKRPEEKPPAHQPASSVKGGQNTSSDKEKAQAAGLSSIVKEAFVQRVRDALKHGSAANPGGVSERYIQSRLDSPSQRLVREILTEAAWASRDSKGNYHYIESGGQSAPSPATQAIQQPAPRGETQKQPAASDISTAAEPAIIRQTIAQRGMPQTPPAPPQTPLTTASTPASAASTETEIAKIKQIIDQRAAHIAPKDPPAPPKTPLTTASTPAAAEPDIPQPDILFTPQKVNFHALGDYVFTQPYKLVYYGLKWYAPQTYMPATWAELYATLFSCLFADYPHRFRPGMSFSRTSTTTELCTSAHKAMLIQPKQVPGTDLFIEVKFSATAIIKRIAYMLDLTQGGYSIAEIYYHRNGRHPAPAAHPAPKPQPASPQQQELPTQPAPQPALDPSLVRRLTGVLTAHFSNGFRLASHIEVTRLRTFAKEEMPEERALSDDELRSYIAACGTLYEGKVYVVTAQTKARIREIAEDHIAAGAQALFYSAFYDNNESWLFDAGVISEGMLRSILPALLPHLTFRSLYFGTADASVTEATEYEILRVWRDDALLSYDQLAQRLPCVPIDKIKHTLSQSDAFIWNSVGVFAHVSRVDITKDDSAAIRSAAERACDEQGYVSVTDLPLDEIIGRNPALSITAIHDAVYILCLRGDYDKQGKIITRKGRALRVGDIIESRCRSMDRCTVGDLYNMEVELTGSYCHQASLGAAYNALVRIDKDTFVADRHVRFDVDATDRAISLFVTGDYLPLRSFTTFSAFPDCGQAWNLFLLESYCRRFSRDYRFDVRAANSKNAGAVIRKSCTLNYIDIMADALVSAGIPLWEASVKRFLFEKGYIAWSTTKRAGKIISVAKRFRERRD